MKNAACITLESKKLKLLRQGGKPVNEVDDFSVKVFFQALIVVIHKNRMEDHRLLQ